MSIEQTWTLTLGPEHPAAHGPITFQLRVDGESDDSLIEWAEPLIHPLHRGAEKLYESRDYRQILMLADRHDWHSAFGSELGLALTIEAALGIAVPVRATWIRTLMAELNRVIHHLRWLGETVGEVSGDLELRDAARTTRELFVNLQETISGGRVHPMLVQPGGLRADVPEGWLAAVIAAGASAREIAELLAEWASQCPELRGVATLSEAAALEFASSGPVGRGSALALDLRFDDSYCDYESLIADSVLRRVTRHGGDAAARFQVMAEEVSISLDCLTRCVGELTELGPGQVSVRLPRSLRLPEGNYYGWTENPTGINGWYVISRGGIEPYRLKLRTASFANAQALAALLPGTPVSALPVSLMSFLLVAGDLAK